MTEIQILENQRNNLLAAYNTMDSVISMLRRTNSSFPQLTPHALEFQREINKVINSLGLTLYGKQESLPNEILENSDEGC
jgi:hypothetical protein